MHFVAGGRLSVFGTKASVSRVVRCARFFKSFGTSRKRRATSKKTSKLERVDSPAISVTRHADAAGSFFDLTNVRLQRTDGFYANRCVSKCIIE